MRTISPSAGVCVLLGSEPTSCVCRYAAATPNIFRGSLSERWNDKKPDHGRAKMQRGQARSGGNQANYAGSHWNVSIGRRVDWTSSSHPTPFPGLLKDGAAHEHIMYGQAGVEIDDAFGCALLCRFSARLRSHQFPHGGRQAAAYTIHLNRF